jgi:hypothetical protein
MPEPIHVTEHHVSSKLALPVVVGNNSKSEADEQRHHKLIAELEFLVRSLIRQLSRNGHEPLTTQKPKPPVAEQAVGRCVLPKSPAAAIIGSDGSIVKSGEARKQGERI